MSDTLKAYSTGFGMYYAACNSKEADKVFREDNGLDDDFFVNIELVPAEEMDRIWVSEDGEETIGSLRSMLERMKKPGLIVEVA